MNITIHFTPRTVKTLTDQFQAALRRGDQRLVKRSAGLLFVADGHAPAHAASRGGVSESPISAWLHAFVQARFDSLR